VSKVPVVRLRDVTKSYGTGTAKTQVLRGVSLDIDQGELVGIFTERDLLNKLTGKAAGQLSIAVRDLMSANPEVLRDTDSVATALNKMSMGRYRHIPVRRADGSYCVTSIKHVLKYIAKAEW